MPTLAWWLVLALNGAAFVEFGWDKWAARRGWRRVPETQLLAWVWLGCGGAWGGMQLFRHKTRKRGFRWRAIALTVVNPLWYAVWLEVRR